MTQLIPWLLLLAGALLLVGILALLLARIRDLILQALPWDGFERHPKGGRNIPRIIPAPQTQRDPRPDELRAQLARDTPAPKVTEAGWARLDAALRLMGVPDEELLGDLIAWWYSDFEDQTVYRLAARRWLATPRGRELQMRLDAGKWSNSSDAMS